MPTILDFEIQLMSAESYSLTVCERGSSKPLASATFSHRVDFLTDFSVDRLNASTKDAAERFDELQKLGRELYQKLFPPAVEQVWREYKQRSEFLILCLRFAEGATKLEVLPWETLYDGAEFIAAGAKTTLTRLPLDVSPSSKLPPLPRPLKLFGFFASPLDLQDHERLNPEREQEILLEAINDPAGQGRISADFEDEAKLEILARSLREGYHILHFTGHGISPRDGGGLLLEDAHGKKLPVSIADVMQAVEIGVDKLRLAVISGCQTARTLHTGAFNDLARELLRQRVPAVIAMQFSISDEGGLKFAEVLYREIAKGVELERAVHAARRVLLEDRSYNAFRINSDALAIMLLAADGACLQTTEAKASPQAEPSTTYLGDPLDPPTRGFYGRRREYRKIRGALLHQDQRAVIIHGIGGIGKTALLTHAVNRLRPRFKDVMSFDCRRAALVPETILLELHRYYATQGMPQLQSLIGQNVSPETLAEEIARLLTEWPLLIVLDNFELQLDERREFINKDLRIFLTTLVKATATGSRFLFTTRYLFDLDGKRLGNLQDLPLGDLSRAEAKMLMQKLPNLAQAALRHKDAVMEKFGGHPYALVALDRHCSYQPLEQALKDASSLESELREYLEIELNYRQLSDRARELLNRLAAFRSDISLAALEWVMGEKQALETNEPIRELIDRGLLTPRYDDEGVQALSVQRLVRNFCHDQQRGESWRGRLRDAAAFYTNQTRFLGEYDKTEDAVWGDMEAFELLIEAEDFADAAVILTKAHRIIDRWGYGPYLKIRYYRLLDKLDQRNVAVTRHNLGTLLERRGYYDAALLEYQFSHKIFEELGDLRGVAASFHQIGLIHQYLCDYDAALQKYLLSLKTFEELGDQAGIARSRHQIGKIYQYLSDYDTALQQYRLSLKAFEELGDRAGIASSLHNIGMIHQHLGNYDEALHQYHHSLKIKQELGDREGVALSLQGIGTIYQCRGEYEAALQNYQLSLNIFEELYDHAGEARLLHQIGIIHQYLGDYGASLQKHLRSLKIKQELGDQIGVARSRHQIGMIYQDRGDSDKALQQFQLAVKTFEELGNRGNTASSRHQIGMIYQDRGDYDAALQQYQLSLKIAEELGDRAGVALSLGQTGTLFTETGRYTKALQYLLSALSGFIKLKSPNANIAVDALKILRTKWGEWEFDTAWQETTGEATPNWLKKAETT